jgi:hypothetical protein
MTITRDADSQIAFGPEFGELAHAHLHQPFMARHTVVVAD